MTKWTREEEEKAKAMAADGLSATMAGRALKRSKNSVLGWAHRNGVKFNCSPELMSEIVRNNVNKRYG